ncbi:MAG: tetratricopeptide repeat protein [Pseudomonadota bacterium]
MIGNILKKLLGKSDSKPKEEPKGEKLTENLRKKSEELTQFLGEKMESVREEYFSIREKTKNLRQTNYDLGMKHLENGHVDEAIIRFKIIRKFWPDVVDAQYQLAYCLVLKEKFKEAKKVLDELLNKNPDYDQKAHDLLDRINSLEESKNV